MRLIASIATTRSALVCAMRFKMALVMGAAVSLAACSHTAPVAVIGEDGRTLTGSVTASLAGSHFEVSDGKLTCSGNYDGLNTSPTITMPVVCDDGRKGFVTAHRESNGIAGSGTVVLKDGYRAQFIFGDAARSFQ